MNYTIPTKLNSLSDSMIRIMTAEANKYGAINMGQGMPEFEPHLAILNAAAAALKDPSLNQYSEDRGSEELRVAVAEKYRHFYGWYPNPENEVTVVCGVTEAIVAAVMAVAEAGQKVVIIEPAHENYLAATLFAGATPVWVPLVAPEFALDLDRIEKGFKEGARVIIFNTPHNPTGRVFTKDEINGLAELCVKYGVLAITDEIYEHILYDGHKHHPLAIEPGMAERTITTSGIGKTYSLTGWRIGFVVAPPAITSMIRRVHTFLSICAPAPLQQAAVTALNLPLSYYDELRAKYALSRDRMMAILEISGFKARIPQGAYYVMADFSALSDEDDVAFCYRMVKEKKVAMVPGGSFYENRSLGRKLVRFAFPKPVAILNEVAGRLKGINRTL